MAGVVLDEVHKVYGDTVAVRSVDLQVAPGEFVTLLGPSGCGKTTCLRMVAGFVEPTAGRIMANIIPAGDMNSDCALVKLMWALGQGGQGGDVRSIMRTDLAGEISVPDRR